MQSHSKYTERLYKHTKRLYKLIERVYKDREHLYYLCLISSIHFLLFPKITSNKLMEREEKCKEQIMTKFDESQYVLHLLNHKMHA